MTDTSFSAPRNDRHLPSLPEADVLEFLAEYPKVS